MNDAGENIRTASCFLPLCSVSLAFLTGSFVLPVDRSPFLTLLYFVVIFVFRFVFEFEVICPLLGCICFDDCMFRENVELLFCTRGVKNMSAVKNCLKNCF